MHHPRKPEALSRLFTSAKTERPVPIQCALFEDALVRASLDPSILAIELFRPPAWSPSPREPIVVVIRGNRRFVLRVEGTKTHSADKVDPTQYRANPLALPEIVLTEADLRSEPLCTNNHLFWSHRRRRVSAGLSFQITQTLRENGAMTLGELVSAIRVLGNSDAAILALACSNLIELDLEMPPLGPATVVRYRAPSGMVREVA